MAESDLHQDEMYALKSALRRCFEEAPDVFVGSNILEEELARLRSRPS